MAGGWGAFALAIGVFLVTHAVPSQPRVKGPLVAALGRPVYLILYSAVSVVALGWLIVAARQAPLVPLAAVARWQLAAPFVLMLPACLLVAFAAGRPNPFSFGGARNARYDPAHPGVVRVTRHPLLAAIALWSLGHALANPDLAHAILFGGSLVMALAGMAMLDRRYRRSATEGQEPAGPRIGPMSAAEIALRAGAAVLAYAALIGLHPLFAGVPIRPYLALLAW